MRTGRRSEHDEGVSVNDLNSIYLKHAVRCCYTWTVALLTSVQEIENEDELTYEE
jgi:hypothetical protein